MKKTQRSLLASVLALLGALGLAVGASAYPSASAGATEQATSSRGLDTASSSSWGWNNSTPGVAGRPYIKYLSVTNGGVESVVINNTGNVQSPDVETIGGNVSDLYAFITPTNGCSLGQSSSSGACYDTPNRTGVSIMRYVGPGWTQDFTPATSTNPVVNDSSVIDIRVGFHSAYSTLRWSWVNGAPSSWVNTVRAGSDGEVALKFTPKTSPRMFSGGCSQIPVMTCDINRADEEVLEAALVLSMDNTLDAALTGVIFGTANAFIGSLESSPIIEGQAPTLTYGVAAPHLNADGSDRRGTFYALLPSSILTLFGTSAGSFNESLLSVSRSIAGSFTTSWSPWNAATNGSDGQFLTISDISFSAPKFSVTKNTKTGNRPGGGAARPVLRVGKSVSLKVLAATFKMKVPKGASLSAKVSTPKVCKLAGATIKGFKVGTCRAVLTVKPKSGKKRTKTISLLVSKR